MKQLLAVFFSFQLLQGILEYERYLKEVVGVLETDPQFRAKLDNASEVDVRVSIRFGFIMTNVHRNELMIYISIVW